MPKIVREDDNFSSFIWKDLPLEALAFVHENYFSDEMTVDEYIKIYFLNNIKYFKYEADRLFEEAKEKAISEGTFPEILNQVWTRQVIKKSDTTSENELKTLFSPNKSKDKSVVERRIMTQKMQQIENELEDLSRMGRNFEENNLAFISSTQTLFNTLDELASQTSQHDQNEAYQEQAIFYELKQMLLSSINLQNDMLKEKSRKIKIEKEDIFEKIYKKRNNLVW